MLYQEDYMKSLLMTICAYILTDETLEELVKNLESECEDLLIDIVDLKQLKNNTTSKEYIETFFLDLFENCIEDKIISHVHTKIDKDNLIISINVNPYMSFILTLVCYGEYKEENRQRVFKLDDKLLKMRQS